LKLRKFESSEVQDADEEKPIDFDLKQYDIYHEASKSLKIHENKIENFNLFDISEEDDFGKHY